MEREESISDLERVKSTEGWARVKDAWDKAFLGYLLTTADLSNPSRARSEFRRSLDNFRALTNVPFDNLAEEFALYGVREHIARIKSQEVLSQGMPFTARDSLSMIEAGIPKRVAELSEAREKAMISTAKKINEFRQKQKSGKS